MRTFWGMARQYRVGGRRNRGAQNHPCLSPCCPVFSAAKGCERVRGGIIARRRRLEHRVRLAGIGIDPEDQEFGRNGAEVDRTIDQFLWPFGRHLELHDVVRFLG